MKVWYKKSVARTRVCAISRLKGVILTGESLLYRLVQEPSSYAVPGLRYEGKYKLRLIIGTIRYIHTSDHHDDGIVDCVRPLLVYSIGGEVTG